MHNIFNETDYNNIISRIHNLTAQSQRQWGTMNLQQMLEHCSIQLKIALGILPASKPEGTAFYRTAFGKWVALYAFPWPKGSATPSGMNMQKNGAPVENFEKEKEQLLHLLSLLKAKENFSFHPFFGALNKKDWGRLIWKHLDHHLNQFGN